MNILKQLEEFIKNNRCNRGRIWLSDEKMKVYVRKGMHLLDGESKNTLDIAAIEVFEGFQRQGLFSDFLKKAHEMNPWDATYSECVNNPIAADYLKKNQWIPINYINGTPESYYLPTIRFKE